MASKWWEPQSLKFKAVNIFSLQSVEQIELITGDPVVKRTEGTNRDRITGMVFKSTTGALRVIKAGQ